MRKAARYRATDINFTDEGKGRVLVLLHGFLGASGIWKPLSDNLKKSYRVICVDLPGHGETACIGYAHSMEMMARAVKAVMDSLRLKKYVMIGHSMGGYVALAFADLYPDNLRGLCLFHSTAYPDSPEKMADRVRATQIVKSNKTLYTRTTIQNLFAKKNLKYLRTEIAFALAIAKKVSRQGIIAALIGMKDRPARDLILGLVQYPIMMVIGEHDNILPPQQLLEQSELIRNRTVLYLEHDGHLGFLESPKICAKAMRKWIRICYR